jgi:hypothetical protein
MSSLDEITDQIKTLKQARNLLQQRYEDSELHQKMEIAPHSPVTSTPKDEEILKLLTAIQQLDKYVKELQEEQFEIIKKQG